MRSILRRKRGFLCPGISGRSELSFTGEGGGLWKPFGGGIGNQELSFGLAKHKVSI